MIKRRIAILLGLGVGPCLAAWGFAPGEFWNDKQPSDWSEEEIQRLLTKSPWAKEVTPEMNFGATGLGGGPGGPGGGMPGGRGGGPGGSGPGMGGPPGMGGGPGMGGLGGGQLQVKAVVRWESAAPIRETAKHQLPPDAAGSYVISVSGLPKIDAGRRDSGPDAPAGDDRLRDMQDRMRQATFLQRKGKNPIAPAHISVSQTDGTLLFHFPIDAEPISFEDKEVVFQTRMGPLELKVKFVLKKMSYRGKLAL